MWESLAPTLVVYCVAGASVLPITKDTFLISFLSVNQFPSIVKEARAR